MSLLFGGFDEFVLTTQGVMVVVLRLHPDLGLQLHINRGNILCHGLAANGNTLSTFQHSIAQFRRERDARFSTKQLN